MLRRYAASVKPLHSQAASTCDHPITKGKLVRLLMHVHAYAPPYRLAKRDAQGHALQLLLWVMNSGHE